MPTDQDFKDAATRLRARLGPVGVWMPLINGWASDDRVVARRVEDIGYGALWFPEGPFTK